MAVSMALRDDSSISEQRRVEIKTVAERMGYQPNINARSLRGGKTHSIGILWSLSGPHDSIGLIRDISLKLMDNSYVSYVADSLGDSKIINSCLKDYIARNIDGLIIQMNSEIERDNLLTAEVQRYLRQIGNVVIVNDTETDLPDELQYDEIQRQRLPAIKEIIDYLVSQGRQRIVMLAKVLNPWREQQFIDCLKTHKLDCKNGRLINPLANSAFIPNEMLEQLKVDWNKYDAILTSNDESAAKVINYLLQHDVKVPEDIAVIGFNDSLLGSYITPPIASVNRRSPEVATAAVDILMKRLKSKNIALQQMKIPMRFVKRESAG